MKSQRERVCMRQSEKEKCSKAEEKNSLEVGGEKQRQKDSVEGESDICIQDESERPSVPLELVMGMI